MQQRISGKEVVYTLCFVLLCVIDQRIVTCSPLLGWREANRDMMGLLIAVFIMAHYGLADIKENRKWYIAWAIIGLGIAIPIYFLRVSEVYFIQVAIAQATEVYVWGFVLIRTVKAFVFEKRRPALDVLICVLWIIMLLLMLFSRSEMLWPGTYLVMFGCLYVTDYSKAEWNMLCRAARNGIILAFLAMSLCTVCFRPFLYPRYIGPYTNSNNFALFLVIVIGVIAVKLYEFYAANTGKWGFCLMVPIMGLALAELFMTIGRIGWVVGILEVAIILLIIFRRSWKSALLNGVSICLLFAVMLPSLYFANRYLPVLVNRPVWFFGEWTDDIYWSWIAKDEEMFVSLDKILENAVGRFVKTFQDIGAIEQQESITENYQEQEQIFEEAYGPPAESVLTLAESQDGMLVRYTIYHHFWTNLNWTGQKSNEFGLQLAPYYWVGHAHNIYLQYGTCFGIPAMVLFIALVLVSLLKTFTRMWKYAEIEFMQTFFWIFVPALFGMFEYAWGAGSLVITLLFIAWRDVVVRK